MARKYGKTGTPKGFIRWFFCYLTAVALSTAVFNLAFAAKPEDIIQKLLHCQSMKDDPGRLGCYDELALAHKPSYITPPNEFLQSEIRVDKNKSEYTLTVSKFLSLIAKARFENKQPVKVLGWHGNGDQFILHIIYRDLVAVEFIHYSAGKENFSVLQPVVLGGQTVSPGVFIINIAAMVPE